MAYNVSTGTLNPTIPYYTSVLNKDLEPKDKVKTKDSIYELQGQRTKAKANDDHILTAKQTYKHYSKHTIK